MVWFGKIDELNHYSAVHIHAEQRMRQKYKNQDWFTNFQIAELISADTSRLICMDNPNILPHK
jgi:hypothetical protein